MDVKEIPAFVRQAVEQAVENFNNDEISGTGKAYHVRFQGRYAYVDRDDGIGPSPVFRLEYTGDLSDWGFAVYKYSADDYDEEENFFPGADKLDGTIEGVSNT
ncbi:MAG: hypothetical protein KGY38_02175 [Desulfobacterales bacterium]|nr:hypothetical protein [Desulfobacterales bacterium]